MHKGRAGVCLDDKQHRHTQEDGPPSSIETHHTLAVTLSKLEPHRQSRVKPYLEREVATPRALLQNCDTKSGGFISRMKILISSMSEVRKSSREQQLLAEDR